MSSSRPTPAHPRTPARISRGPYLPLSDISSAFLMLPKIVFTFLPVFCFHFMNEKLKCHFLYLPFWEYSAEVPPSTVLTRLLVAFEVNWFIRLQPGVWSHKALNTSLIWILSVEGLGDWRNQGLTTFLHNSFGRSLPHTPLSSCLGKEWNVGWTLSDRLAIPTYMWQMFG